MRNPIVFFALLALASQSVPALAEPVAGSVVAPSNAQVYFIWPHEGSVIVNGKFWVRMGLRNMGVAPKGTGGLATGHHHLLIDTELPVMTEPIPNDRNHLHFGAGETEARVELPPGKHRLQLLLGDKDHRPHNPPVLSKPIMVLVK